MTSNPTDSIASPDALPTVCLAGKRYLTPAAMRRLFPYKNNSDFWSFIRDSGIPHIRLNARRILFDEADIAAFLHSRRVSQTKGNAS